MVAASLPSAIRWMSSAIRRARPSFVGHRTSSSADSLLDLGSTEKEKLASFPLRQLLCQDAHIMVDSRISGATYTASVSEGRLARASERLAAGAQHNARSVLA